uniref:3-oxo-5alpha-steroid 4-dehydrogenase (NADP(+)) n=1 Tax=Biomphalaria glabrata TaxID=6526 RepID=A0A182Z9Y4_BIOGL
MASTWIQDIISFVLSDEKRTIEYVSYIFIFWGLSVCVLLMSMTAPYGRYSRPGWGILLPGKIAWFIQELPCCVVPLLIYYYADCPKAGVLMNRFSLGLFLFHYFHRTFLFPFLIRGGKPTPLFPFVMAFMFCTINGYVQTRYILKYADLTVTQSSLNRIIIGTAIFFIGMGINLHSDHILRNLRKPGEKGYKIPYGGMFLYISGANFFGEIVEWFGFAVLNWSLPAAAFSLFTICNIAPRAVQHHRWYQGKFKEYPKNRKAIIPFLF